MEDIKIHDGMTYEDVVNAIEALLDITTENLDAEALKSVKIFSKFQHMYRVHVKKLETLTIQFDKLKNFRWRYYAGKASPEVYAKEPLREAVLKTEIDNWLKVDDRLIEMKCILNDQERIVKAIEEAKSALRERGYTIRNAIDFQRMSLGM